MVHEVLDSYTCELCGENFTGYGRRHYYKKHMKLHSITEKNFKCKDCDRKFFLESEMKQHWRLLHGEKKHTTMNAERKLWPHASLQKSPPRTLLNFAVRKDYIFV